MSFSFYSLCFSHIFSFFVFYNQVLITENPKSFSHFITNVCAIIGGVFTVSIFVFCSCLLVSRVLTNFFFRLGLQVAGIMDSILHNTIRMMRKVELGKNFWWIGQVLVSVQEELFIRYICFSEDCFVNDDNMFLLERRMWNEALQVPIFRFKFSKHETILQTLYTSQLMRL